jgi:tellurium resistance protein TerD
MIYLAVSTWWKFARRADLGITDIDGHPFAITNKGWYLLRDILPSSLTRNGELLLGPYVPTVLAQSWGNYLIGMDPTEWVQVGRWNGVEVALVGAVHRSQIGNLAQTHELVQLTGTPLHQWLQGIGQELSVTPSGLVITGEPVKGNPLSVNLSKGEKVNLTKQAGGTLTKVSARLGWDARVTAGEPFDLDASVIGLDADGVCVGNPVIVNGVGFGKEWFVFYNHKESPNGAIIHNGDDLTGGKKGDDEKIDIDLTRLDPQVVDLRVVVTINQARARKNQSFSTVENAFVRIVDEITGTELARFDLSEATEPGVNAVVFGKLYRHDGAWNFRAIGDGFTDELDGLVRAYKVG